MRRGVNPLKLSYNPSSAPLTASAFNRLGHCANIPGNRAYCYAELAVSSLAVAITITTTHYAYPRRDSQAELACVARLNTVTVYPRTVILLSTNPARRRVASLMHPTMLPLHHNATQSTAWSKKYDATFHKFAA